MTATTICQLLDFDELTLIESADSPISGVGESTAQLISKWMDLIDIDIKVLVKYTEGSFKHSIKWVVYIKKTLEFSLSIWRCKI